MSHFDGGFRQFWVQLSSACDVWQRVFAEGENKVVLLAISNEISILLIAVAGLLASISLAFLAYRKGEAGEQSLKTESFVVLTEGTEQHQDSPSRHAA